MSYKIEYFFENKAKTEIEIYDKTYFIILWLKTRITKGIEGICTHPSKKLNYEDTSNSNKAVDSDDESDVSLIKINIIHSSYIICYTV